MFCLQIAVELYYQYSLHGSIMIGNAPRIPLIIHHHQDPVGHQRGGDGDLYGVEQGGYPGFELRVLVCLHGS